MSSPLRRSSRTSTSPSCTNSPRASSSRHRTPPEHDTTPTKKRRRQSLKPVDQPSNTTSRNSRQSPLPQPPTEEQDPSDAKKERDARKKARRSLGRRVSFAATARVRLFNKDATPEISPEAARKSRFFALDDLQESINSENSASPLGLSMFQIPDLSSVVTGGENTFDLRLSLDGSDQTRESDKSRDDEGSSKQISEPATAEALLPHERSDNQGSPRLQVPPVLSKIIGAENVIIHHSSLGSDEEHMQLGGNAELFIPETEDFAIFTDPPSFDDAMDVTECIGGINAEPFENTENILPIQSTRLDISHHHMPNDDIENSTAERFQMSPISNRRISIASPSYRRENSHIAENSTAMDLTRCLGGIINDKDESGQVFDEEVHGEIHDGMDEIEGTDPTMNFTRCIGGIREAGPPDYRNLIPLTIIEEERKTETDTVVDDDLYADHVEYNIHLNDGYNQLDVTSYATDDEDDDMDLTRCIGAVHRQENDGCFEVEGDTQRTSRNPSLSPERAAITVEKTPSTGDKKSSPPRERPLKNIPTLVLEAPTGGMRTEGPAVLVVQDKENVATRESVQPDCGPRPSEAQIKEKVTPCSPRRPRRGYVSSPLRTVTTMLSPGKVVTNVALSRQAVIVNRRKSLSATAADPSARLVSSTRRSSFAGSLGKPLFEEESSSNAGMVGNVDSVLKSTEKTADTSTPSPTARRLSFTPASTKDFSVIACVAPQHSPDLDDRMSDVTATAPITATTFPRSPEPKSPDTKAHIKPPLDRMSGVTAQMTTTTFPNSPEPRSPDTKAVIEPPLAKERVENVASSPIPDRNRKLEDDDKNHLGELDEPCIFGEHLDIVDDSFIAEIPDPDPITLATFFEMTGIHFVDERGSTKQREEAPTEQENELPSFADCVKATAISYPELERNEFCCKELEKYITEGKQSVSKMEEAVNRDNPPVFADLIRTHPDSDDRNRMLANLRIMKSRARLEAKSSWYRWREQLLSSAKCGLKTVSDQLKRDHKYVTRFAEQVDALLPELKQYRASLAARHKEAKSRQEAIATCDRNQMQSLNEAIREQSAQVDFFRQQLEQAELEGIQLNEKATALETEKASLLGAIASAQLSLNEFAGFDAEDLFRLRDDFDRLTRYHLWTPAAASKNALELVFDGRARARIDVAEWSQNKRVLASLTAVEPEKDVTEKESLLTTRTFLPEILHLSTPKSPNTPRPISQTLRNVSAHVYRLGIIEQEIALLRLRQPVSLSPEPSALKVRVTFVGLQRPVKFRVEFEIEFEGTGQGGRGLRYPFGELKWTVEKAYGVVNEDTISDVMSAHEQDGYHRMLAICRDLEVMTR